MSLRPTPADIHGSGETNTTATASDRALLAVLASAIVLYFVVRGWLATSLVLIGIACAVSCVVHRREVLPILRLAQVRWLLVAFSAPMLASALVNAGHQDVVPRSFDAALRFLLALPVFLELRRRSLEFSRHAELVFPIAIALCAGLVMGIPTSQRYYWAGRFATYFIDPIVLCQHVLISAFICLFLLQPRSQVAHWKTLVQVGAIGLAVLVALGTQSRSGWTMVPILATVWLLRDRHVTARQVAGTVAVVLLACGLAYLGSSVIKLRFDQVGQDLVQYANGSNRDTSVGLRLSLFRAAVILFTEHPLLGWGFRGLPDLSAVPAITPFYTPALQSYFVGAGVHNEFLQAMMRMGLLGLASRVLLFLVPFWLFARAARSAQPTVRLNGFLGLVVVIGYITVGLTSEVTNLIYAASFYALLVAVFAAGALPRPAAG